jgi:hypothetical protein
MWFRASCGRDHLAPGVGPVRHKLPPSQRWIAVAANSEVIANAPNGPRNRCACSGYLIRRIARSRWRVGWCEFSARLLSPLCRRYSELGSTGR